MTRRLSYGFLIMLAMLVSCTTGKIYEPTGPYIELTVYCEEPETRSGNNGTEPGLDYYNENYINTVDFFFYPGDTPDRTADATYHKRMGGDTWYNGSAVFMIDDLNSDIINSQIFPVLPKEYVEVTVFAIANYPGTLVADENDLTGTSLTELEDLEVSANFAGPADFRQELFMMSGTTVLGLRGRTQILTASGSVSLQRYASKLTVGINVKEEVELQDGQVWKPMLEGMAVYLVNGVSTVKLGGLDDTPDYFSYSRNQLPFATKDINTGAISPIVDLVNGYYYTYPMYSYPAEWTYGSNEGYDREPYLKLVVPWFRTDANGFSQTERQLYYKVMMPEDAREGFARKFVRNNWYHINIDVSILGAQTDDGTVTVEAGSCFMVYWQQKDFVIKQAELGKARYLSVDKQSYELNNVAVANVAYTTSHPVVIKEGTKRVTRPYYGEKGVGTTTPCGGVVRMAGAGDIYAEGSYYIEYDEAHRRALSEDGGDWFYNSGTSIVFSHELNADYTKEDFDYSPYDVSFTIVHEDRPDDERYTKDITIKQYPAIFIEATRNSDDTFRFIKNGTAGRKLHESTYWGYVYVDGQQLVRQGEQDIEAYSYIYEPLGYTKEEYQWRVVWYTGGSRDIFKMNVTVLPEGSSFVIGDPRSKTVDNPVPGVPFKECKALYDGDADRSLKYYYPAENSTRTEFMLAPSYRIASKCGGVEWGPITLERAKCRCAAYQEDGFPAGRWRLPTKGEINFIAMLSANNAFTYLFSSGSVYWSANGAIRVNSGSVSNVGNTTALVRCVYDSWYWGDGQQEDRTQFVWGDKPR